MRLLILLAVVPTTVLSCPVGYDPWLDGRCFSIGREKVYDDALSECKEESARLPVIRNVEENDQFYSAIKKNLKIPSFWLSLACDGNKFHWADGTIANYTNFDGSNFCGEVYLRDRYFYFGKDGKWHDSNSGAHSLRNFVSQVCEDNATAPLCEPFSEAHTDNTAGMCYQLQKQGATWYQAEFRCKAMGGHLITVHDEKVNDFIKNTAVAAGLLDGVHIGLQENEYGNYTWVNGRSTNYDNFVSGFPNAAYGSCVAMKTGYFPGQWLSVDCNNTELPYVCAMPALDATIPGPSGCPVKTVYGPGDEIFSPSYPRAPGVSACEYILVVPNPQGQAEVTIEFLESNLCCDSLIVYDGLFGYNILETLTGFTVGPKTIHATTNAIRMRWNATSGANVRGFRAIMSDSV